MAIIQLNDKSLDRFKNFEMLLGLGGRSRRIRAFNNDHSDKQPKNMRRSWDGTFTSTRVSRLAPQELRCAHLSELEAQVSAKSPG